MYYEEQFSDLPTAMGDLHARFRQQLESRAPEEEPPNALCRLRLAVHEWVANLARHARFGERPPRVHVRIWRQNARLYCTVEDNSQGFDLEARLDHQPDLTVYARTLPDGGMGLLMMKASTERVEYETVDEQWNCLRLSVRTGEFANAEGAR